MSKLTSPKIIKLVSSAKLNTAFSMFAGKTSELLKRILWAKHQNKKIIVIKPTIDDRYANKKIITHNNLSHDCFAMKDWEQFLKKFDLEKKIFDVVFVDEIQFMDTKKTMLNIENILNFCEH